MNASIYVRLAFGLTLCVGCGPAGEGTSTQSTATVRPAAPPSVAPAPPTEIPRRAKADLPQPLTLTDEDWPQYRGQLRDGTSRASGLLSDWSEQAPQVVWETPVGQGYAAPSVVAGRVYVNDYDEDEQLWMVRCLNLDDGEELWRYEVKKRIRPNHAITRTAPATDGGFVFAIDPKCELHCLDARDGTLIWKKFFPVEYGSQIPAWYNGQCPLIDGDRLIVATDVSDKVALGGQVPERTKRIPQSKRPNRVG